MSEYEDLLDYRRRVAEMYARVRSGPGDHSSRALEFRRACDELLRTHPQSALSSEQKATFTGLRHYPYDPALRFVVPIEDGVAQETLEVTLRDDGLLRLRRIGRVRFRVDGADVSLALFWIHAYGGGIFLPFRDRTNGVTTYAGGRYLLDTIKGADLGQEDSKLVLDFNYAHNRRAGIMPAGIARWPRWKTACRSRFGRASRSMKRECGYRARRQEVGSVEVIVNCSIVSRLQ